MELQLAIARRRLSWTGDDDDDRGTSDAGWRRRRRVHHNTPSKSCPSSCCGYDEDDRSGSEAREEEASSGAEHAEHAQQVASLPIEHLTRTSVKRHASRVKRQGLELKVAERLCTRSPCTTRSFYIEAHLSAGEELRARRLVWRKDKALAKLLAATTTASATRARSLGGRVHHSMGLGLRQRTAHP
jgi:hypothetical protein